MCFSDLSLTTALLVRLEIKAITDVEVGEVTTIRFDPLHSKKERCKIVYQALRKHSEPAEYLILGLRGGTEEGLDLFDLMLRSTNNTQADPTLSAAASLDAHLRNLSLKFVNLKISTCLTAPFIDSEVALTQVMEAVRQEVVDKAYLHEFFLINIVDHVKRLEAYMRDARLMDPQSELNRALRDYIRSQLGFKCKEIDLLFRNMTGFGVQSYGVRVDIDFVACLLVDEKLTKPRKQVIREFTWLLSQLNQQFEARVREVLEECLDNIEAEVRYHKLRQRDIKVSEQAPLVTLYFYKFKFPDGRSLVCLRSGEAHGDVSSPLSIPAI